MANTTAFQAMGKTYRLNLGTTSAEVAVNAYTPCNQVRIHNGGTEAAIRFSATTGAAAVFPVSGTPSDSIMLQANQTQVFSVPQASITAQATLYVSGIVASGTSLVYITPGEGL